MKTQVMKTKVLSRRAAIVFSVVVSVVFWIAIAGMFVNLLSDEPPLTASQEGYHDIAPAGGAKPGN
jgi:hypothetical protein